MIAMPPIQTGPDYPYGSTPLRPQWTDRWAQVLSLAIVFCAVLSLAIHAGDWPIERLALMIIFPALLGITLAFAPDPPALISRLAKRLTVAACAIGTLRRTVACALDPCCAGDAGALSRDRLGL
jgi:hypothetical protein